MRIQLMAFINLWYTVERRESPTASEVVNRMGKEMRKGRKLQTLVGRVGRMSELLEARRKTPRTCPRILDYNMYVW